MLKDSRNIFDMYMSEQGLTDTKRAISKGVYKKLERWEMIKNKDIFNMSKEEIIGLCQEGNNKIANRSYGGMKTRVDAMNDIFKWLHLDIKLSMSDFNTKSILTVNEIRYFTKEEIQEICDLFINPQDKFIVYGLFCGIYSKGYKDLLELEVKDIDMENRVINTPSGEKIKMDDYLYDITKDTIDPIWGKTYYKYIKMGEEGSTTSEYELNMDCKYVLKAKRYSKNNDGQDAMKINGLQRRLKKLAEVVSDSLGTEKTVVNVKLSGTDLLRSGIMYRMYFEEVKSGEEWTCASLQTWLKENQIKSQVFELYRLYKNKYTKEVKRKLSVN